MDEIKLNNLLNLTFFYKEKILFDSNAERNLKAFTNACNFKYEVFFDE